VHRTGRAGASGTAISLVCIDEAQMFSSIKRLVERNITQNSPPPFSERDGSE
jgi:ATP-dependent RNA helicase RhlE